MIATVISLALNTPNKQTSTHILRATNNHHNIYLICQQQIISSMACWLNGVCLLPARGVYTRHPYGVLLGNLCGKTNVLLIFIASFFHRPPTQLLQLLGRVWGYSVVRTTPLQTFRDNGDTLVVIALVSYPGVKRSVPMCGMVWWCVFRIPVGLLVIISHLYSSKLNAYSSILCISLRLVSSYRNLYYYFWQGA